MTAEIKGNILVLDGEPQVLDELTRLLEAEQYRVFLLPDRKRGPRSFSRKKILTC